MTQPLPGDILVFLTGQDEIDTMEEILRDLILKLGDQIDPMIVLFNICQFTSGITTENFPTNT